MPSDAADTMEFIDRLGSITKDHSSEQAAELLFPNDQESRAGYLAQVQDLEASYEEAKKSAPAGEDVETKALPAFVAAALPIIAKCVISGLGAAGINEIITLVHKGEQASAESRVYALVGGCIQGIIPWGWLANKLKKPIATAVLWIIIKWYS